jgi:hypothetical protein
VLLMPAGYSKTGWSFQGIFCQPQAFGVYLAMFGVFLAAYVVTSRRLSWTVLVITALTGFLVYSAHCRTAMLAFTLTTVLCLLAAVLLRRDGLQLLGNSVVVLRVSILLIAVTAALAYDSDGIARGVLTFAGKKYQGGGSTTDVLIGSVENSRGNQIRRALDTIRKNPLTGVGFGVAPEGLEQIVIRDPVYGLPISAPAEEGFLPLGVLSQVGVIGAVALLLFVFRVALPIVRWAPLPVFAMFVMAMCLNLGEMIFFASGDLGLYLWLIVGLCFEYSRERQTHVVQSERQIRAMRAWNASWA